METTTKHPQHLPTIPGVVDPPASRDPAPVSAPAHIAPARGRRRRPLRTWRAAASDRVAFASTWPQVAMIGVTSPFLPGILLSSPAILGVTSISILNPGIRIFLENHHKTLGKWLVFEKNVLNQARKGELKRRHTRRIGCFGFFPFNHARKG